MTFADPGDIAIWHAHVSYDPATRDQALLLREAIGSRFDVLLGRMRDEPVGPHPKPMFMVEFPAGEFTRLVPWLSLNHRGFPILIHPETGDFVADHRDNALWINERLELNLS